MFLAALLLPPTTEPPGAAAVEFATWLNTTIAQRQAAAGGALGTPECRGMLPALRACAAAAASTTANSSSCCVNTTSSTSQGCCPQQCSLAASKVSSRPFYVLRSSWRQHMLCACFLQC